MMQTGAAALLPENGDKMEAPASLTTQAGHGVPGQKPVPGPGRIKLTALLLTDNPCDLPSIERRLAGEFDGHFTVAGDRRMFEAALGGSSFDVILVDDALPHFGGLAALRVARAVQPATPFILLAGAMDEEKAVKCLQAGATDYVLKERSARLAAAVRRAMGEVADRARQRAAERAVHELTGRLLRAQDEERRRIARELHDGVAQNLTLLHYNLTVARPLDQPREQLQTMLHECAELTKETAATLRTVAYLLHPPMLDVLGLRGAVRDFAEGFSRRSGLRVTVTIPPTFGRLPQAVETVLFRVVQESLTNVHRHSCSDRAQIGIRRRADTVVLEVRDFGKGFSPGLQAGQDVAIPLGVGIAGMRERLQQFGGWLEIISNAGGTLVRAVVSLPRQS